MSKSILHDPSKDMPKRKMARFQSVNHSLTEMEPEELDAWLNKNVKTVKDCHELFKVLIQAVGALKR